MVGTCYISGEQKHNETNTTPAKIDAIYVENETERFHPAKQLDLANYKTNDMVNGGGLLIFCQCTV